MICTPCSGSGFLNFDLIPEHIGKYIDKNIDSRREIILKVFYYLKSINKISDDVCLCPCCSDGLNWYGQRGEHYNIDDPYGPNGPYAYNNGVSECN